MDLPPKDQSVSAVAEDSLIGPSSRRNSRANIDENVKLALPQSAYFIIFVEGCERFCYYGLRTVLLLYFLQFLALTKDSATIGYHLFTFTCHFTPTLGAILSDGFIGRYFTILTLSIIYFIGTVVLTITAVPNIGNKHLIGPFFGLLLIAIGTGGIKPCVNTFGADQIPMSNPKQLNQYFIYFYVMMNIGSLSSMIITPLLRSKVECFGYNCYTLAFGVPSCLMLIAIVLFIIGTPSYKRVPPKNNVISNLIGIIWRGIRNAICRSKSEKKEHWLHYADDKHAMDDIEDVRLVLRVCVLFIPISMYYALSNQQGSRWTYQASLMDGRIGPFGTIQPDQMQAISSIFALLLLPVCEQLVYPIAARFNWFIKPLQRMYFGLILTIIAFLVAAIVQERIESKADAIPVRYYTDIYNDNNCSMNMNFTDTIQSGEVYKYSCDKLLNNELLLISTCDEQSVYYRLSESQICPSVLLITRVDTNTSDNALTIIPLTNPISRSRGERGYALLRLVSLNDLNATVVATPNRYTYPVQKLQPTAYHSVLEADYRFEQMTVNDSRKSINTVRVRTTAVYTVMFVDTDEKQLRAILFEDVPPFTVHILWQTIQYFFLSAAEIFVYVTGLGFAYSQAPKRYKVIIMSAWLLNSSFGDLIVILVAKAKLTTNQTTEFLLFAIFMAYATFIFGILAMNYKERKSDAGVHEDDHLLVE